jgi:hypothetical protein
MSSDRRFSFNVGLKTTGVGLKTRGVGLKTTGVGLKTTSVGPSKIGNPVSSRVPTF